MDEHAWAHPNRRRGTSWATGIVDLTPGRPARLLEVTPGRSGAFYAGWLAAREQHWRDQIRIAALDPFRGYLAAARTHLSQATHVLDAFHVTRLGMQALDEVRRRVQQQTLARRGHKGDPLYETRRVLRRRADRLSPRALARVQTALRHGDPDGEVTAAWWAAQQICLAYAMPDPASGRRRSRIPTRPAHQHQPPGAHERSQLPAQQTTRTRRRPVHHEHQVTSHTGQTRRNSVIAARGK